MLSLTYEEIERQTRVRAVFLEALENGALEELPSPVQTRGILANYAVFLDLDADTILLRFADGLQARYREKRPDKPSRARAPMTVNTKLPPLRVLYCQRSAFWRWYGDHAFAFCGVGHRACNDRPLHDSSSGNFAFHL